MSGAFLILRFNAPMMAFGGARIDGLPGWYPAGWYPVPTPSMLTGLFGGALGLDRRETGRLQALQDTLAIASAVLDRDGVIETDYQTADLTKPFLAASKKNPMWTVEAVPFWREGSEQALRRRQQERHYLADWDILTAVWLTATGEWDLPALADALDEPRRAIYIGRASCPAVGPLVVDRVEAPDPCHALEQVALGLGAVIRTFYLPLSCVEGECGDELVSIGARRRWAANVHGGAEIYVRRNATASAVRETAP